VSNPSITEAGSAPLPFLLFAVVGAAVLRFPDELDLAEGMVIK
jgi:hypothetical protein